jgi:hypothetical protein
LKLYRYLDNTLKLLQGSSSNSVLVKKDKIMNCSVHAWVNDDRIIAGMESGDLMLFESTGEFKAALAKSAFDTAPVNSITPFSKGFIVGTESGTISFYEKTEDKEYYKLTKATKLLVPGSDSLSQLEHASLT